MFILNRTVRYQGASNAPFVRPELNRGLKELTSNREMLD
jgi:hypothetical protein